MSFLSKRPVVVLKSALRANPPHAQKKFVFKRAQRGLFHGKTRQTGFNVSFSHRRTKRAWLPNIQRKSFFSPLLEEKITTKVTTKALRCIDKAGGIDPYLLYTKDKWLASEFALDLRARVVARFKARTGVRFKRSARAQNDQLLRSILNSTAASGATVASTSNVKEENAVEAK